MILEFDWNRRLFLARSRGSKSGLEEAVNRPKLAFAVSPKYLSNETKIYIFITRIPRVVYIIFLGFFKNLIFPTSGRYLQTSALNKYTSMIIIPLQVVKKAINTIEILAIPFIAVFCSGSPRRETEHRRFIRFPTVSGAMRFTYFW